ncbi:hypothetical protein [Xylanibacter muris]|nr:hypothetical protein [Xylanibacter muris]
MINTGYIHLLFLLMLSGISTEIYGQTFRGVVIDLESRIPMRDVDVIIDDGLRIVRTDWQGRFSADSVKAGLTFRRSGYIIRRVSLESFTDTIGLLPEYNRLSEVVVYGRARKDILKNMGLAMKIKAEGAVAPKPSGKDFLSFLNVFDRHYVSKKQRRKRMKAIENY